MGCTQSNIQKASNQEPAPVINSNKNTDTSRTSTQIAETKPPEIATNQTPNRLTDVELPSFQEITQHKSEEIQDNQDNQNEDSMFSTGNASNSGKRVHLSEEEIEENQQRRRLSVVASHSLDELHTTKPSDLKGLGLGIDRDIENSIGNGARSETLEHGTLPLRFACVTRPGNDPAKRQKENQDSYSYRMNVDGDEKCFIVGVYDGHGPNGALASAFVKEKIPAEWNSTGLGNASGKNRNLVKRIIHEGCVKVNKDLADSPIDCYVSGSTGIMGVFKDDMLYCANVGDSRAVLGKIGESGNYVAVDLSNDHKPDRPDEMARIIKSGGRVFEWGVPRVWRKEVDMPGLAMARSFGDQAAETVGVFAEPEISVTRLSSTDKFVVFATDGVWEFLSSTAVVYLISQHFETKPPEQAIRDAVVEIVNKSVEQWTKEEDVVDDCTCIIVALNYSSSP